MQVLLHLQDLILTKVTSDPWYGNPAIMTRLLTCIEEMGWLDRLPWFRFGNGPTREVTNPSDLARGCQTWGDRSLYLLHRPDPDIADLQQPLSAMIYPWYRKMNLLLNFTTGEPNSPGISLADLADFIQALQSSFGKALVLGPEARVRLSLEPYPSPWPPRRHALITFGNLLECFSARFLQEADLPRGMAADLLQTEPPDADRAWWLTPDLRAVQWAKNLDDPEALLAVRARQAFYWANRFDLPLESGFEPLLQALEAGDDPFVSGYHRLGYHHGYQYLTVSPDGSFDLEKVRTLTTWQNAGQLPDGRRLTEVFLIVPTLRDALTIYRQVRSLGVKDVYFLARGR